MNAQAPAVPFLLRTAHNVPRLCESLRDFSPQPAEDIDALAQAVDRQVDRAEPLFRDGEGAEVDHRHIDAGLRLTFAMVDVSRRG